MTSFANLPASALTARLYEIRREERALLVEFLRSRRAAVRVPAPAACASPGSARQGWTADGGQPHAALPGAQPLRRREGLRRRAHRAGDPAQVARWRAAGGGLERGPADCSASGHVRLLAELAAEVGG